MAEARNTVTFTAEFKEVKSRKLSSLDKEYRVVFTTTDQSSMLLDNFASDEYLKITVEPAS